MSVLVLLGAPGCAEPDGAGALPAGRGAGGDPLDAVARAYVKLVLAVGRHDQGYVDAYYGPAEWRAEAEAGEPVPPASLLARARELRGRVRAAPPSPRAAFLEKQLVAVEAFLRRLTGETLSFAEEARLLYDVAPERHEVAEFEEVLRAIEALVPGEGELAARVEAFRARFVVPPERLAAAVDACLAMTREKTRALVGLPEGEAFEVAYVTGKPWSAYNWYQGGARSRIEVNVDLPVHLGEVCSTMAHEGYPGHHTYNALLEARLVRGRGWPEYAVYPLYSPQSLVAEGTAEAGVRVLLTKDEWASFIAGVLAPLAGLEGEDVQRYLALEEARRALRYVPREAARMFLDEGAAEAEVVAFLVHYGLTGEDRARKRVDFFRAYRAYIVNYTAGEDLVEAWLGEGDGRVARFFDLLTRPVTPSELARR